MHGVVVVAKHAVLFDDFYISYAGGVEDAGGSFGPGDARRGRNLTGLIVGYFNLSGRPKGEAHGADKGEKKESVHGNEDINDLTLSARGSGFLVNPRREGNYLQNLAIRRTPSSI